MKAVWRSKAASWSIKAHFLQTKAVSRKETEMQNEISQVVKNHPSYEEIKRGAEEGKKKARRFVFWLMLPTILFLLPVGLSESGWSVAGAVMIVGAVTATVTMELMYYTLFSCWDQHLADFLFWKPPSPNYFGEIRQKVERVAKDLLDIFELRNSTSG